MLETLLLLALLSLLLQQGSPDYATREQATAQLTRLNVPGPALLWGSRHCDPEIAARSKAMYRAWCWQTANALRPVGYPWTPWVDSLPECYPERAGIIDGYLSQAGYGTGDSSRNAPPEWNKYRLATVLYVYDLLATGKSEAEIQALFGEMVTREREWVIRHKGTFKFTQEQLIAAGQSAP